MSTRILESSDESNVYNDTISSECIIKVLCVQPCRNGIVTPPVHYYVRCIGPSGAMSRLVRSIAVSAGNNSGEYSENIPLMVRLASCVQERFALTSPC